MNFILIDPLSSLARHVITMSGLVHLNILLIYCRSFRSENVRLLLVLRLLLFSNLILPDYQNIVSFGLVCTSHFRKYFIEPARMVFLVHSHKQSFRYSELSFLGLPFQVFTKTSMFIISIFIRKDSGIFCLQIVFLKLTINELFRNYDGRKDGFIENEITNQFICFINSRSRGHINTWSILEYFVHLIIQT